VPDKDLLVDHTDPGNGPSNDAIAIPRLDPSTIAAEGEPVDTRVLSVVAVARYHGVEMRAADFRPTIGEDIPSPASLAAWARSSGLHAKADRVRWRSLFKLQGGGNPQPPVILLMKDGTAAVMVASDLSRNIVWLRDPGGDAGQDAVPVDELRMDEVWGGEVLLIRATRAIAEADKPFSLGWLMSLVAKEKGAMRDVCIGSLTLSALTIIPPLLVMTVLDRVVTHHSMSTLVLLAVILGIATAYETLLGFARRELVQVVSARVDAKLNLHVFNRLLSLPLDYFEKNPAGQVNYRISQVWKVREFLTGKLMGTFLDMFTLAFLLPILFWMDATMAWMVLVCAGLIALVILAFLPALRRLMGALVIAESNKATTMVESVHGIRTIKSLALEPNRKAEWDERVAIAGDLKLKSGRLANWPQTLIAPLEAFIQRGVIMVGA
jgi:ATP-binding cassette subfamily B protein